MDYRDHQIFDEYKRRIFDSDIVGKRPNFPLGSRIPPYHQTGGDHLPKFVYTIRDWFFTLMQKIKNNRSTQYLLQLLGLMIFLYFFYGISKT